MPHPSDVLFTVTVSDRYGADLNLESVSDVAITHKVERRSQVFYVRKNLNCFHILDISW
jgi:hypothetical protein